MVAPYLPVLTLLHAVFTDEIHIAEYGRLFLDPHSDWSLFWQGDHGITPWYFIGGLFEEFALRATSPSCAGSRLLGLLGSVLASGALVAWLWRRGTLPAAALLLGWLFLFNPIVMPAYTAGRIDGWAQCCAFAAGYQIVMSGSSPRAWRLFTAGGLLSLAFFVWPSVAYLLPLLGIELWRANRSAGRSLWPSLVMTGVGAGIVFLVLGLTVLIRVPNVLRDVPSQLAVAGMAPHSAASGFAINVRTLVAHLIVRNPWNVPLAFIVWRSGASRAQLLWMMLPISIMFFTMLYGNRLIYMVPYLMVAFSGAFARPEAAPGAARAPGPMGWWLLLGSVAASFVFAAVLKPVMPWLQRATRSESLLYAAAERAAPRSARVCFDGSVEFYLVGRSRDWRMFTLTPDTLPLCDSAIVRGEPTPELAASLASTGFARQEVLLPDQVNDAPAWEQHAYGYYVYGPYEVYRRRP
jgi:hypothetical protein